MTDQDDGLTVFINNIADKTNKDIIASVVVSLIPNAVAQLSQMITNELHITPAQTEVRGVKLIQLAFKSVKFDDVADFLDRISMNGQRLVFCVHLPDLQFEQLHTNLMAELAKIEDAEGTVATHALLTGDAKKKEKLQKLLDERDDKRPNGADTIQKFVNMSMGFQ